MKTQSITVTGVYESANTMACYSLNPEERKDQCLNHLQHDLMELAKTAEGYTYQC